MSKRFFQLSNPFHEPQIYATTKLCDIGAENFDIYNGVQLERSYANIRLMMFSNLDDIFLYRDKIDQQYKICINDVSYILDLDLDKKSVQFWPGYLMTIIQYYNDYNVVSIYHADRGLQLLGTITEGKNEIEICWREQDITYIILKNIRNNEPPIRYSIREGVIIKSQSLPFHYYYFSLDGRRMLRHYYALHLKERYGRVDPGLTDILIQDTRNNDIIATIPAQGYSRFYFINDDRLIEIDFNLKSVNIYNMSSADVKQIMTINLPTKDSLNLAQWEIANHYPYVTNNNLVCCYQKQTIYLIDTVQRYYVQLNTGSYIYSLLLVGNLLILNSEIEDSIKVYEYNTLHLDRLQYYIDEDSMRVRTQLTELLSSGRSLPNELLQDIAQKMYDN